MIVAMREHVLIEGRKYTIRSDVMYSKKRDSEYSLSPISLSIPTTKTGRSASFDAIVNAAADAVDAVDAVDDAMNYATVDASDYDEAALVQAEAMANAD